jgi:hypothetical protein
MREAGTEEVHDRLPALFIRAGGNNLEGLVEHDPDPRKGLVSNSTTIQKNLVLPGHDLGPKLGGLAIDQNPPLANTIFGASPGEPRPASQEDLEPEFPRAGGQEEASGYISRKFFSMGSPTSVSTDSG